MDCKGFLKKNNKGLTLVELICAIAILAIVSISIVSFVSISSKSFKESSNDVNLQYESQQVANQVKELIMDANRAVCYYEIPGVEDGAPSLAHTLLILNENPIVDDSGAITYEYPAVKVWFVPSDEKIYYATHIFSYADLNKLYEDSSKTKVDMKELAQSPKMAAGEILASHVSSFFVDDTKAEESGKVNVTIGLSLGDNSYTSNPTVIMRNKVIASENVAEIFDGTKRVERKGFVKSVSIKFNSTTLPDNKELTYLDGGITKPNSSESGAEQKKAYTFLPEIVAYEESDAGTWSLSRDDGKTIYSTVENGTVYISSKEEVGHLILTLTSVADTSKNASVWLWLGESYDLDEGYITGLSVVQTSEKMSSDNKTQTFIFTVTQSFDKISKIIANNLNEFDYFLKDSAGNAIDNSRLKVTKISETESSIEMVCNKDDSNNTYFLSVTSKAKDHSGKTIEKEPLKFTVATIVDTPSSSKVSISGGGTFQRNTSENYVYVTVTDINVNQKDNIVLSISGEKADKIKWSCVKQDKNKGQYTFMIDVPIDLPWDKAYEYSVSASIKNTDYKSNTPTKISVKPVSISFTPEKDGDISFKGEEGIKVNYSAVEGINWDSDCSTYLEPKVSYNYGNDKINSLTISSKKENKKTTRYISFNFNGDYWKIPIVGTKMVNHTDGKVMLEMYYKSDITSDKMEHKIYSKEWDVSYWY